MKPPSPNGKAESREAQRNGDIYARILQAMERFSHLKDVHALLDEVLLQARRLTRADAGSIYLIQDKVLDFSYIHNDTLFAASGVNLGTS